MSEETADRPAVVLRRWLVGSWRSFRSVYYANSLSWRALKSGALAFFGFFLWASANLLLSYRPGWTFLHYPMAYGFVVAWYGPVHHAVVIPVALRLRRSASGAGATLGRHLPNLGLAAFAALVLVLGTYPAGPMTADFGSTIGGGPDVNPALLCTASEVDGDTAIHCHLSDSTGIDSVAVESGGERLLVDDDPPFDFTVRESELAEVVGQKQFQVVLLDESGGTIRRYTRTMSMVD